MPEIVLHKIKWILATRSSPLALQQAHWVQAMMMERLRLSRQVEILPLGTTGDRIQGVPLPQIGGKGLFTRELEDALREGRAHFAVHSLKDLPTELPEGLVLACVPQREDPHDALVSREGRHFAELPSQATVGTSSIRRAAQLRWLRPDLNIVPLRGNLGTRLRKLQEGTLDAIVVAAAGMRRMGLSDRVTEYFPEETLCPAVGQGALAIEACDGDAATLGVLTALEDLWARVAVTAERALLQKLGGGCQVPIAAIARRQGDRLAMSALVVRPDGSELIRAAEVSSPGIAKDIEIARCGSIRAVNDAHRETALRLAETLGKKTAESLLEQGAARILELLAQEPSPPASFPEIP